MHRKDSQYVSMRRKWLNQITRSIEKIHICGVVWEDSKGDNVLIDSRDDAYFIDFGGGYTKGSLDSHRTGYCVSLD